MHRLALLLALGAAAPEVVLRLGTPGTVNSGVSLAASGRAAVVAWAARSGDATDILAAFSLDGGASFGSPIRVNDVPGDARVSGEQAPRVVLGAEGTRIVWQSRRGGSATVLAASAGPGQQAFSRATSVHGADLPGARGWASSAPGVGGTTLVAWLDGREGRREPAARGPRQDLYFALWRPDGTHQEARVAREVCFCCKTAVAAGPDGAVYVAWRHIYPPNLRDIAVARSADGGKTFGPPVRVSEDGWAIDGCPDDGPSIAVDPGGVLHVVWPTVLGEGAGKGVFYSSSVDGGRTFAPRLRLDEAGGGAAHPQLAAGAGRLAVAWDQAGPRRTVALRELRGEPGAPRWGGVELLGGQQPGLYPAVAIGADATLVAWTEDAAGGSQIRVRRLGRSGP